MTLQTTDCFADTADVLDYPCEARAQVAALWSRLASATPFSPVEEQVIALAASDALSSLDPPGAFDRLFALLFGRGSSGRTLADPRLESLRRAAVVARHRHHLPDAEAARLRAAGFVEAQIRILEARAV